MIQFDDEHHGSERKRTFLYALQTAPKDFRSNLRRLNVDAPDFTVSKAILLSRGIRDYGKWQEDLRDKLNFGAGKRNLKIETSIPNYDYLPLLPFLFGYGRTDHVQRLMDHYAEMRSRFPLAECSFLGHSNGTYLLAAALRRYGGSRFARVVFVGSIVQRNRPWLDEFRKRVGQLRNYVSSTDATVAIFPSLFEVIRLVPLLNNFPPPIAILVARVIQGLRKSMAVFGISHISRAGTVPLLSRNITSR